MRMTRWLQACVTIAVLAASGCKHPRTLKAAVRQFEQRTGVELHVTGTRGEPLPPVAPGVELGVADRKLAVRKLPLISDVLMAYPGSVRETTAMATTPCCRSVMAVAW